MKKILSLALFLFAGITIIIAQPQKMTYQTVVRDVNNNLVVNQQIGAQISILEDSINGNLVYSEIHYATTNANGLVSIVIGDGQHPYTNTLADVQWDKHDHFLRIEIDPAGGINYTITGTQQLITVPYAFYSGSAKYVDTALYATNANSANNALSANYANSASTATTATTARYSTYADTADYNMLLNKPAGTNMGDILYWDAGTATWQILPIGNVGEILTVDSNHVPHWNATISTINLPMVQTDSVINLTSSTAVVIGTVTDGGGTNFVISGCCWDTIPSPTLSKNYVTSGVGTTTFTSNLLGLTVGNTYYVRTFATNSAGTVYGNELTFTILELPTVTTDTISAIASKTAVSGGTVTSSGGTNITARGVCWSTSPNPTINDSLTSDSIGLGHFTSSLSNLTAKTKYYVRAYATNIVGTAYGSEYSFTTTPDIPTVTTTNASNIGLTFATIGGTVTNEGGATVTTRGICWDTLQNPTIAGSHTSSGSGLGNFSINLTSLITGKTYYVRAYATNSEGTAYGNEVSFVPDIPSCPGAPTVKDIDNNVYHTVLIGTQCWMRENLRTTRYANGSSITEAPGTNTSTSISYYYHTNGDVANDSVYGLLYNWVAVMRGAASSDNVPSGVMGVCPIGWHVPSRAEYDILRNYVKGEGGCSANANGKPLASKENWQTSSSSCNVGYDLATNNSSGFSLQPAGWVDHGYEDFGRETKVWTSTQENSSNARCLLLPYQWNYAADWDEAKYRGQPVRCLKDDSPAPDGQPCPDAPDVTDIDGNTYNTVLIGSQCWMKENLRATNYPDGNSIDEGFAQTSTSTGYYYHADDNSGNDATYGLLYNWTAAMNGGASSNAVPGNIQGVCPDGWHIPSAGDFDVLRNYVKGQYGCNNLYDGRALAATANWLSCSGGCNVGDDLSANDSSGFSLQPSGWADGGSYNDFETQARLWSSKEENSNQAHYLYLNNCDNETYDYDDQKYHGYSIRCLKNDYVSNWRKCTGTPTVTDVDGNTYNTVQIGSQCWMKENLRTTQYANGNPIDEGYAQTSSYTGYYYHVDDNSGNDNTYGLLYNWAAAMHETDDEGTQGVCPDGWHLPSRAEFQKLRNYFNGDHGCDNLYDGKPLAADANWYSCNNGDCNIGNDIATNNTTGFSLQPAGWADGSWYNDFRSQARLWASTEENPDNARFLWFENCRDDSWDWDEQKHHAYSVRCIKDNAVACPGIPTVTDDEGNTYHTILIGSQCWMRENLRTTVYNDGVTPIDNGESDPTSDINGYYYHVDGDPGNDGVYGLLYNWAAAMNYDYSEGTRGICPSGWHIPSSDECDELLNYVRGDDDCDDWQNGRPLAADDNWEYCSMDCHIGYDLPSNNSTGFSIQPAGWFNGNFNDFRYQARIWSSTEEWPDRARYLYTENCYSDVLNMDEEKQHGYSVRCIKDEE